MRIINYSDLEALCYSFCCVTLQVTQTKGYSLYFDLTGQNTKKMNNKNVALVLHSCLESNSKTCISLYAGTS
jgi:hypothetical protein